jgi:SAM-dependent methyltransferase
VGQIEHCATVGRWYRRLERLMHARDEVDRIADVYRGYAREGARDRRWAPDNPGNRAIVAERLRVLGELLAAERRLPLDRARILEVGAGDGDVLASLVGLGARPERLVGVDLLPDEVARARARHPELRFAVANAEALDLDDHAVDLVLLFTVLTSILDAGMTGRIAAEVDRVLAPGGAVVWYDFRIDNPRNPHVRGVGRRRIRALFPGYRLHLRSVTVLPPLARRLGWATAWAYPLLSRVPLLRTHYLGLLAKPA